MDPLEKSLAKKSNKELSGPELERATELVRNTIRVVVDLSRLEEASGCRRWIEFMDRMKKSEELNAMFLVVENDNNNNNR